MFVSEKKYLKLVRAFNAKFDELKYSEKQLDALISANNSLKRKLYNKEKELTEALIKEQDLADKLKPKSCDGCIHTDNYRKCTSCARYPKIKDKYEVDTE